MAKLTAFFCAAMFSACICGVAMAQTFGFAADEFISRFDKQLESDGGDTIKGCKRENNGLVCRFHDMSFQKSVEGFKSLDLANGRFELSSRMVISTKSGKVSSILIAGDRGDPMNLFHFIGQMGSLLHVLEPSISDEEMAQTALELGLMRGDSDPSIGHKVTAIKKYAAITCNSQHSKRSTAIGCIFEPRY